MGLPQIGFKSGARFAFLAAAGISGLVQANPAHALGGSVVINQSAPGGPTTVTVTDAYITLQGGNLAGVTGPLNIDFTIAADGPGFWISGGQNLYFYDGFSGFPPTSIYTSFSGNKFTGALLPDNTAGSTLTVYDDGRLEFEISSSINNPPSNCYTGLQINESTGVDCQKFINVLALVVETGVTGIVPSTAPSNMPTISALLQNYTGAYSNSIGSFSAPGTENIVAFSTIPVPAPLPVLGATTAFAFSRRIRRRMTLNSKATSAN